MNGLGAKLNESEWDEKAKYDLEIINLKEEFWKLDYVIKFWVEKRNSLIIVEAHSEQIIK